MKTKILLSILILLGGLLPVSGQNSFWINDPTISWNWQTGNISEATLSVHPKGLYMEYGLYLTLSASSTYFDPQSQLEAVLDFSLPKGAIVLDNWLWVGNDIIQGKLVDRWSASDIYEGIVNRRRDPSVMFKNSETQYQLRVYPIKKENTRKVKITYLMPVDWMKGKAESAIPGNLVMTSGQTPDLNVLIWEERGFTNPAFNDAGIVFQSKSDSAFGLYKKAMVPAGKIQQNLVLSLDAPMQNGIYMSVFEDQNTNYYQMALSPGTFISQVEHQKILVLIDYEAGNSTLTKPGLIAGLKQRLLADYGPGDSFNIVFSKLRVELANDSWKPITAENLNLALDPLVEESLYSNLPGLFATGFDFIKSTGGSGSLLLVTSSDNFGNYEQANALIKDLKKLQDPLPPIFIADIQDQMLNYYYIGNRYYYGQEYLYVNLSKASGGYYKTLREKSSIQDLLSDVVGSIAGMITAFDMYTAPSDGFCYGRFGSNNMEGLPVNQTLTQVGKFIGQTPFIVYLTGLYQTQPFSHLVQVADEQISQADTMLAKMWHGRYISDLERSDKNNMIIQEILYESLNNRVLSQYSAFLCLEPSDTISVCQSCKDETDLLGIDNPMLTDSAGFIKLYPNPFRDRVTLEISTEKLSGTDDVVIRIFSLTGQVVFEQTQPFTPGKTIVAEWKGTGLNGESVKAGQYIVMVRAGQGVWSRKLIKSE